MTEAEQNLLMTIAQIMLSTIKETHPMRRQLQQHWYELQREISDTSREQCK